MKSADVTFWIYEDGACIHAGRKRRHFEQPDYDSLDDLGSKFIQELVEIVA